MFEYVFNDFIQFFKNITLIDLVIPCAYLIFICTVLLPIKKVDTRSKITGITYVFLLSVLGVFIIIVLPELVLKIKTKGVILNYFIILIFSTIGWLIKKMDVNTIYSKEVQIFAKK